MGQDVRSPRGPRCIALVGPFQSGKTTLLEAILARTGAVQRQGTVDAGTSVGDSSKEARHHKMSVELTAATTSLDERMPRSRWRSKPTIHTPYSADMRSVTATAAGTSRRSTAPWR